MTSCVVLPQNACISFFFFSGEVLFRHNVFYEYAVAVTFFVVCPQVPFPVLQGHQILSVHKVGLGGGGSPGLPSGLQHAEPADSQKEPQLPALGLQLQLEACENPHHKSKQILGLSKMKPNLKSR